MIFFVDAEDAVPWTAPIDVKWKDLANGKITPFNKDGFFFYVRCGGLEPKYLERVPSTYKEWEELCGCPESLKSDSKSNRKSNGEITLYNHFVTLFDERKK